MEAGTGVMTITPWHDATDFEIAQRHNLDFEQIIDERGRLLPIAGEFADLKILEARPKIIEKLKSKGLLVKVDEKYTHTVQLCYKCANLIEPQVKDQWFVKMKPLAEPAIEAVENDTVRILTEQHKKIALNWLNNINDWNISRQISWGIPIPAKLCTACGHGMVDIEDTITVCEKCGGEMKKDPDTFDTWFSSGQWPFITLDYPDGEDFKTYYPTDVMETGHDILFFWVTRMIVLGLYKTGDVPFNNVYLHGLVRDARGQKMSKSKGNVINPLHVSEQFGTDALRMALVVGNTPGTDLNLDPQKVGAYKKFANKLWNIARFVLENYHPGAVPEVLPDKPQGYLDELVHVSSEVTTHMENYRLYLAAEKLYHYIWHRVADEILEESKEVFKSDNMAAKIAMSHALYRILIDSLKMLHPFMPFVTETIWQALPEKDAELLLIGTWPAPHQTQKA
jgi:valyl-tRNA synthetase